MPVIYIELSTMLKSKFYYRFIKKLLKTSLRRDKSNYDTFHCKKNTHLVTKYHDLLAQNN